MSPDIERRLRAALRAGAELIDEPTEPTVPAVPADFRPPDATPATPTRSARTNRRHRERWLVPASIAAAVAVIAACTIVVVRITASEQDGPVGPAVPTAVVPSVTSPSPTSERTSPTQGSRAVTTTPSRPVRSSRSGLAGTTPPPAPTALLTEPNRVMGGGRTAPSPARSETSTTAPRTSSTGTGRQVTTDTQLVDAQLLGNGRGYVRTGSALLWTDDDGAHWRDITPPGLTRTQLQAAAVAVQLDGRTWVAVAPTAGDRTLTVWRRSATIGRWTDTAVALGDLTIYPGDGAQVSLSFADASHGWLMVFVDPGHGELLRTTDGGATWFRQPATKGGKLPNGLIHFVTPTIGFMDTSLARENLGWWITRDAGARWTKLRVPAPGKGFGPGVDAVFNGFPRLVDGGLVAAANVVVDLAGYDGTAIYRSTDGGKNWSLQSRVKPGQLGESWDAVRWFAVSPNGLNYVLLASVPAKDGHGYTWVTSRSVNHGKTFTDTTSSQHQQMFVTGGQQPFQGALSVADSGEIWALGDTDTCGINTPDCGSPAALFASHDGGTSWHRVSLPH